MRGMRNDMDNTLTHTVISLFPPFHCLSCGWCVVKSGSATPISLSVVGGQVLTTEWRNKTLRGRNCERSLTLHEKNEREKSLDDLWESNRERKKEATGESTKGDKGLSLLLFPPCLLLLIEAGMIWFMCASFITIPLQHRRKREMTRWWWRFPLSDGDCKRRVRDFSLVIPLSSS